MTENVWTGKLSSYGTAVAEEEKVHGAKCQACAEPLEFEEMWFRRERGEGIVLWFSRVRSLCGHIEREKPIHPKDVNVAAPVVEPPPGMDEVEFRVSRRTGAFMAMQALLQRSTQGPVVRSADPTRIADDAVKYADAVLARLQR